MSQSRAHSSDHKSSKSTTVDILSSLVIPPVTDQLAMSLKRLESSYKRFSEISDNKAQWNALTEQEKIANEKSKLTIMQEVHRKMDEQYSEFKKINFESGQQIKQTLWWRKCLLVIFMIADLFLLSIGCYFGSISLLPIIIPSISTTVLTVVVSIMTAIEASMIYCILRPMIQQGLGIPQAQPNDTVALHYGERLALVEKMNSKMVNNVHCTDKEGPEVYSHFASILKLFNRDMAKVKLSPYQESTHEKVARYSLTTLSVTLSGAGTYFGTMLLLTALCAPLIATPVGFAIVCTLIAAQLLARLFIRQHSVYKILNPSAERYEAVRNKLDSFEDRTVSINRELRRNTTVERIEGRENFHTPSSGPASVSGSPRFLELQNSSTTETGGMAMRTKWGSF